MLRSFALGGELDRSFRLGGRSKCAQCPEIRVNGLQLQTDEFLRYRLAEGVLLEYSMCRIERFLPMPPHIDIGLNTAFVCSLPFLLLLCIFVVYSVVLFNFPCLSCSASV